MDVKKNEMKTKDDKVKQSTNLRSKPLKKFPTGNSFFFQLR